MNIIQFKEKWNWYVQLISAGCPDHMLSIAFYIANRVDGRPESDKYGQAYPNVEEISEATGKKHDRISAITKVLHDQGWIIKDVNQRRTGRKTFYTLAIGVAWEAKQRAVSEKSLANLKQPSRMVSEEVTPNVSEEVTPNVSEEPSRMVSDNKSKPETYTKTLSETLTLPQDHSPRENRENAGDFSIVPKDEGFSITQRGHANSIDKESVLSNSDSFGVAKASTSTVPPAQTERDDMIVDSNSDPKKLIEAFKAQHGSFDRDALIEANRQTGQSETEERAKRLREEQEARETIVW